MPKVSIIMGVYNCKNKELLEKSVDSIIVQTFTDWEFLICDDGSSDNTRKYLNEIGEMDSRIRIIGYSQNHGLAYALNYCLKQARGEYIARQDDDDLSYPDRIEREVAYLDKHPMCSAIGCLADVYDDQGIWGEYKVEEHPSKKDFLWNSPFIHPTVIIRARALKKIGGYRVSKETRRCEDYDMFMRLYAAGFKGNNIQQKLYKYWIKNDKNVKYRPMKFRIDEAIVRFKGYKELNMLARGFPYIFKPIILGLIPQRLLYRIKKTQY